MTPFTHSVFQDSGAQLVQVRVLETACCARVLRPWVTHDGLEMWQVESIEPLSFQGHFPARNVAQCSGLDGRCACAGEFAQ